LTDHDYLITRFYTLKGARGDLWQISRDDFFKFALSEADFITKVKQRGGYKIGRRDLLKPYTAENIAVVPYASTLRKLAPRGPSTKQLRKPRVSFAKHRELTIEQWVAELRQNAHSD